MQSQPKTAPGLSATKEREYMRHKGTYNVGMTGHTVANSSNTDLTPWGSAGGRGMQPLLANDVCCCLQSGAAGVGLTDNLPWSSKRWDEWNRLRPDQDIRSMCQSV